MDQTARTYGYTPREKLHVAGQSAGTWVVRLTRFVILAGVCFITLMPLVGVISRAFMSRDDFYNPLVYFIARNPTLDNINMAAKGLDYGPSMLKTVLLCLGVMALQTFVCSMVGYGFARFKLWGGGLLFGLVVLTIVVPMDTFMVSLYMQFRYPLGSTQSLLNTAYPTLLMSAVGMGLRSGLYIYIYRQFFKGMPAAVEEAACIDGAGVFRTFFQVMLPNATSSIIIVMLFSFVWQYNDTFMSGLFMNSMGLLPQKLTSLAATLSNIYQVQDLNEVGLMNNAGVLLVIAPLIVLYLFLQKYFMQGIERSGIVG